MDFGQTNVRCCPDPSPVFSVTRNGRDAKLDRVGAIRLIKPEIPIILFAEFSQFVSEKKAYNLGIRAFVMKPKIMSKIALTIRKSLKKEG